MDRFEYVTFLFNLNGQFQFHPCYIRLDLTCVDVFGYPFLPVKNWRSGVSEIFDSGNYSVRWVHYVHKCKNQSRMNGNPPPN